MAKIRLTKNELKKQKDNLKRYMRYLPTLELKKKQLLQEILRIQHEIDDLLEGRKKLENDISQWAGVFADGTDLAPYLKIQEIKTSEGNIAGIEIPIFEDVQFRPVDIDDFATPLWIDTGITVCQEQIRKRIEQEIAEKQQGILREELRITIQRIKMFEEVKIPEAKDSIRVIRIFLGDLQTAEVIRGKIAKSKIQKKKLEAAA